MSFQSRAFIIVFLITSGSIIFIFWASLKILNEERRGHFASVASERTLSMRASVESELRRLSYRPDHELVTAKSPAMLKQYSLPRWPAKDEFLVGSIAERSLIFGRNDDGGIWFNEFSRIDPPWHKPDVVLYWFTTSGALLGANSKSVLGSSFSQRPLLQLYRLSNGGWGGEHLKQAGGPIFAAFHEVPNTNIVVAAEFPTAVRLESKTNFYITFFIVLSSATILVYLYSRLNSAQVTRLCGSAAAVMQQFRSGSFSVNFQIPLQSENLKLLEALSEMEYFLQLREKKISNFTNGIRQVLIGCRSITGSQDSFEICARAARLLLKNLSFAATGNAWVYLSLPSELGKKLTEASVERNFIQGQLLGRGEIQMSQWIVGPCQKISDPSQVLAVGKLLFEPSSRLVIIPLVQDQKGIGFLVLEGYKLDLIPDFEAFLMEAVACIACPLILTYLKNDPENQF
jgi:hypothetical protein